MNDTKIVEGKAPRWHPERDNSFNFPNRSKFEMDIITGRSTELFERDKTSIIPWLHKASTSPLILLFN